jgi:hypothetical protein
MKRPCVFIAFLLLLSATPFLMSMFSHAQKALVPGAPGRIYLKGIYNGKNLYVQNPFDCDGEDFCITDCRVNGSVSTRLYKSSALEIKLDEWGGAKIGDSVFVEIGHKECCMPKVLNAEVLDGDWLKRDSARRR